MKKSIIIYTMFFFSLTSAWTQVRVVVMGGISPESSPSSAGLFVNRHLPIEEFVFNMTGVKSQYFGGVKAHIPLNVSFFSEAGLIFTRKTSIYSLAYTYAEFKEAAYLEMSQTEDKLLVPVSIGVHLGILDVTSGLMGIVSLAEATELDHISGYATDYNRLGVGWSTGIRINILQSAIGIEYQGSLDRVGRGMYVNGQPLEIMNVPGQWVATIQYRL